MRYNLYSISTSSYTKSIGTSEWVYKRFGEDKMFKSAKIGSHHSYEPVNELEDGILNCQRRNIGMGNFMKSGYEYYYYLVPETNWLFNANLMLDYTEGIDDALLEATKDYILNAFYALNSGSIKPKN